MTTASRTATPLWLQLRALNPGPGALIRSMGVKVAPVPVERIARAIGVVVEYESGMVEDGRMDFHKDATGRETPHIYVNSEQHINRQRFTIAHELGHLLNPRHPKETQYRGRHVGRPALHEREADAFAAALLMPKVLVRAYTLIGVSQVDDLAKRFMVSPLAMAIRMRELTYNARSQ